MIISVERQLDEFRREVDWNIACGALADVELPVTDDEGGCPVVVALEEEPLFRLLGRLQAVGGYANLFIKGPGPDHRVSTVSIIGEACAIPDADDNMADEGERPDANATVGMFLAYLSTQPGGVTLSIVSVGDRKPRAHDAGTVDFVGAL